MQRILRFLSRIAVGCGVGVVVVVSARAAPTFAIDQVPPVSVEPAGGVDLEVERLRVISLLNHCRASLLRVTDSRSGSVLEREYSRLFESMNLDAVPDIGGAESVWALVKALREHYMQIRVRTEERVLAMSSLQAQLDRARIERWRRLAGGAISATSQAAAGNPIGASALRMAEEVSEFMFSGAEQQVISALAVQESKSKWRIEDMSKLHALAERFEQEGIVQMRQHRIPDMLLLRETDLRKFQEATSRPDPAERLEQLRAIRARMQAYPDFWMALAAAEASQPDMDAEATLDAIARFRRSAVDTLRIDDLRAYAAVLEARARLAQGDVRKAAEAIEGVRRCSPSNPEAEYWPEEDYCSIGMAAKVAVDAGQIELAGRCLRELSARARATNVTPESVRIIRRLAADVTLAIELAQARTTGAKARVLTERSSTAEGISVASKAIRSSFPKDEARWQELLGRACELQGAEIRFRRIDSTAREQWCSDFEAGGGDLELLLDGVLALFQARAQSFDFAQADAGVPWLECLGDRIDPDAMIRIETDLALLEYRTAECRLSEASESLERALNRCRDLPARLERRRMLQDGMTASRFAAAWSFFAVVEGRIIGREAGRRRAESLLREHARFVGPYAWHGLWAIWMLSDGEAELDARREAFAAVESAFGRGSEEHMRLLWAFGEGLPPDCIGMSVVSSRESFLLMHLAMVSALDPMSQDRMRILRGHVSKLDEAPLRHLIQELTTPYSLSDLAIRPKPGETPAEAVVRALTVELPERRRWLSDDLGTAYLALRALSAAGEEISRDQEDAFYLAHARVLAKAALRPEHAGECGDCALLESSLRDEAARSAAAMLQLNGRGFLFDNDSRFREAMSLVQSRIEYRRKTGRTAGSLYRKLLASAVELAGADGLEDYALERTLRDELKALDARTSSDGSSASGPSEGR